MSLTTAEINAVVKQIAPLVNGGVIVRIDQYDRWSFVFNIRKESSRCKLKFVAHPSFSRLHLMTGRQRSGAPSSGLCNVLRQHLTESPVESISAVPGDRVVKLCCVKMDALLRRERLCLIAELTGKKSNLILTDSSGSVLGALFTENSGSRVIRPGVLYKPPPLPPPVLRAGENRFATEKNDDVLSLSRAVEDHYKGAEEREKFEKNLKRVRKQVQNGIARLEKARGRLKAELGAAAEAEDVRRDGELLKMVMPPRIKGRDCITVEDVFENHQCRRRIKLDSRLSLNENIQLIFRRYKKLKNSIQPLRKKLAVFDRELEELEKLRVSIHNIKTLRELKEFEKTEKVKNILHNYPDNTSRQGIAAGPKGPRKFFSRDGYNVLVARNRAENHSLTFSTANGSDCWLHVLGSPGAHVIIKRPGKEALPNETILDAAHLAIYYSKMRGSGFARVIYADCKNLRPAGKRAFGGVHYSGEVTIGVRFSKKRLLSLFERAGRR